MRRLGLVLAVCSGCGNSSHPTIDGAPAIDAVCQPTVLLAGGSDVTSQGWSIVMEGPATLSDGPDYVRLATTTSAGATTGGQLLLSHPGAIEAGKPFAIQVVMLVEAVSPHNQLDSAAAILASFTPPFGTGNDRSEMIYLDADKVGWADNTQAAAVAVANSSYHTYEISVDAARVATVTVDGTAALTRSGFTTSGTIAIGDQTNEKNVDSALRIRSVTRLCVTGP